MANELAAAYVTIIPSLEGMQNKIQEALGSAIPEVGDKTGRGIADSMANGLKNAAGGAMLAAGAVAGVAFGKGFGRLKAIDEAKAKLTGLGSSAAEVETVMANANAAVRGTSFGLDAAATAAAGAMAAGIKPGKELEQNLKLVADAATIAGTDMGSMGAIFNKVAASNKVQMDVINQLHDAGVPALSMLADQMGVTAEEASKMASQGKIDFATFQAAMEKGLGGAAQSSGDTFTGALANVMAALGRVGANLMGGPFSKMAPLFQAIANALGPLEELASRWGDKIAAVVNPAIEKLTNMLNGGFNTSGLQGLGSVIAPVAAALGALGAGALPGILSQVPLVGGALGSMAGPFAALSGPIGIAAAALAAFMATGSDGQALADGITSVLDMIVAALPNLTGMLVQVVTSLANGIAQALPQLAMAVPQILTSLVNAIVTGLPVLIDAGLKMVFALVEGLIAAIPQLIAALPQLINSLLTGIIEMLPAIIQGGIQLVIGLITGIIEAIPQLIAMIPQILVSLLTAIIENLPLLVTGGIQLILGLIVGIVEAIPALIDAMVSMTPQIINALMQVDWAGIGRDLLEGIKAGIIDGGGALMDTLRSLAQDMLDSFLSFFDIHSPSRVMRDQVGKQITAGLGVGIDQGASYAVSRTTALSQAVEGAFAPDLTATGAVTAGAVGGGIVQHIHAVDGMSEAAVAEIAAQRLQFDLRGRS